MVVSTTQVEDWDDSSSFLMEWLLRPLSLASIDLMSVDRRARVSAVLKLNPRASLAALLQALDKVLQVSNC